MHHESAVEFARVCDSSPPARARALVPRVLAGCLFARPSLSLCSSLRGRYGCSDDASWHFVSPQILSCSILKSLDPGCRELDDVGQKASCKATCGTCVPRACTSSYCENGGECVDALSPAGKIAALPLDESGNAMTAARPAQPQLRVLAYAVPTLDAIG